MAPHYEIELKAWVDDPNSVKERLDGFCLYTGEYQKDDTYWNYGNSALHPGFSLRIRQEQWKDAQSNAQGDAQGISTLVTYKTKEIQGDMEVNLEQEFAVSAVEPFINLLLALSFEKGISKQKTGWSWSYGETGSAGEEQRITVELSLVASLGWLVELELIAQDRDEATVSHGRERLHRLLGFLGIGEDRIETRYYSELLTLGEQ